jgi:hypothetical protein
MPGLLDVNVRAWSTNSLTHGASVRDSCTDSLGDQVALKLCHGAHDVKQKFAARRSGVDACWGRRRCAPLTPISTYS